MSDDEVAKILKAVTCAGIDAEGTVAATMKEDWLATRAQLKAEALAHLTTLGELQALQHEIRHHRHQTVLRQEFCGVCEMIKENG